MAKARTAHPMPAGSWVKARVQVEDSGEHNVRVAEAGSAGRVESVEEWGGRVSYVVVFHPSGVVAEWDEDDLDANAEALAPGHPDIPSDAARSLAGAVSDIVALGLADADDAVFVVAGDVVERVRSHATPEAVGEPEAAEVDALIGRPVGRLGNVRLAFEAFDRLAALVGVADRSPARDDGFSP